MNKEKFYSHLRIFGLISSRVKNNLDLVLDLIDKHKSEFKALESINQTAYILATFFGETGDFTPKREGAPRGRDPFQYFEGMYGATTRKGRELGNKNQGDGYVFRGSGLTQNTGRGLAVRLSKIFGVDLVADFGLLARDLDLSFRVGVYCMENGIYTGHKLDDYIADDDAGEPDFREARRIVNPGELSPRAKQASKDQLRRITGYAEAFAEALKVAREEETDDQEPVAPVATAPLDEAAPVVAVATTNSDPPAVAVAVAETPSTFDKMKEFIVSAPDSPAVKVVTENSSKIANRFAGGSILAAIGAFIQNHTGLFIFLVSAAVILILSVIFREYLTNKFLALINADPTKYNVELVNQQKPQGFLWKR